MPYQPHSSYYPYLVISPNNPNDHDSSQACLVLLKYCKHRAATRAAPSFPSPPPSLPPALPPFLPLYLARFNLLWSQLVLLCVLPCGATFCLGLLLRCHEMCALTFLRSVQRRNTTKRLRHICDAPFLGPPSRPWPGPRSISIRTSWLRGEIQLCVKSGKVKGMEVKWERVRGKKMCVYVVE